MFLWECAQVYLWEPDLPVLLFSPTDNIVDE